MVRRCLAVAGVVVTTGCSLLSLDVLQGAEGTGGSSTAVGTTNATATGAGGGATGATTSSGATATTSTGPGPGSGGATASSSSGGGAGGCDGPDACAGSLDAICENFDGSPDLVGWTESRGYEDGSTIGIATDRFTSCPNAARVAFTGAVGNDGGWAGLVREVPGAPKQASIAARVYRETDNVALEGALEVFWKRGDFECFLQIQLGGAPAVVQGYAAEFDPFGSPVELGGVYVELDASTTNTWIDLTVDVVLDVDAGPSVRVGVGDIFGDFAMDPSGDAVCDDGPPDDGTFAVFLGAPYNSVPTVLYYDDVRVSAP